MHHPGTLRRPQDNAVFTRKLGGLVGGSACVLAAGFTDDGEGSFVLAATAEAWEHLNACRAAVSQRAASLAPSPVAPAPVPPPPPPVPPLGGFGGSMSPMGMGMDPAAMMQMLASNPQMMQQMSQQALSNPMMQQMAAGNPQLQAALQQMSSNPAMLQQALSNPMMQAMMRDPQQMERARQMMMGGASPALAGATPGATPGAAPGAAPAPGAPADPAKVQQVSDVTGLSTQQAAALLQVCGGNVEAAIGMHFGSM